MQGHAAADTMAGMLPTLPVACNLFCACHKQTAASSSKSKTGPLTGWKAPADGTSYSCKLNLVDLAGSERSTKTGAEGSTAREAMHINRSLTFLEQVSRRAAAACQLCRSQPLALRACAPAETLWCVRALGGAGHHRAVQAGRAARALSLIQADAPAQGLHRRQLPHAPHCLRLVRRADHRHMVKCCQMSLSVLSLGAEPQRTARARLAAQR